MKSQSIKIDPKKPVKDLLVCERFSMNLNVHIVVSLSMSFQRFDLGTLAILPQSEHRFFVESEVR